MSLVLGGSVLLETSCTTPGTRDEWLRFFFDGVPVEGEETAAAEAEGAEEAGAEREPLPTPVRPGPRPVFHEPIAEDDCQECHQSSMSQGLVGTLTEVCFTCHDEFAAEGVRMHGPVEDGECTTCHDPHRSKHRGLLVMALTDLCNDCHDDVTEAEVKHSPAEEGECLECHNPHAAGEPGLLVAPVPSLCFACHDEEDVAAGDAHQTIGEESCTACHDPHQGEKEYYLR